MKRLTIVLLTTALICHSQTIPTLKGHSLGESLQEFTAKADDLSRGLMIDCITADRNNAHAFQGMDCRDLLRVQQTGSGTLSCALPMYKTGVCRNFEGTVKFTGGKIVEFRIKILNTPWSDALGDSITKFGKPEETHTSAMQNGYGAKFDLQEASWATPVYMADLCELINLPYNLNRYSSLHLVDRAYYDSEHKPHSSSLD